MFFFFFSFEQFCFLYISNFKFPFLRSLVANLSAAEKYKKTHFDSEPIQKVLNDCSIFYATAFFITHSFDSLMALGKFANEHNKPFLVNLAAPFVAQFFKDQLNQVLQHADVIFGNETEALGYGKVMGFGVKNNNMNHQLIEFEINVEFFFFCSF